MALSTQDRNQAHAEFMREGGVSITKDQLRAAFNALDDWFDANAATLNAALPAAARTGLSSAEKARLMKAVLTQRYIKGA